MKNEKTYSFATVILVSILTGCSDISNAGMASEINLHEITGVLIETYSLLPIIFNPESKGGITIPGIAYEITFS